MRRSTFIKLVAMRDASERIAESNNRAARATEKLTAQLAENSKAEIKARDRVDITLEEYEFLKHEVESLRTENAMLRGYLSKFDFPVDAKIIPDSIQTACAHDVRRFVDRWQIKFDVEAT